MEENEFLRAAQAINAEFNAQSGLDYLRAVIASKKTYPFGALLQMEVTAAGDGTTEIAAQPSYAFYNPMMRVHGGYLASLMDAAMGSAVLTKLAKGQGAGTVQLNLHFVRKVDVESGRLLARARTVHAGRSMLTTEAHVTDAAGRLCVHGTGTFLVYPK